MKIIEIDCWEVTQPDGGGMREERVALVSSEDVAKAFVAKHNNGWPCSYRKYEKEFVIFDMYAEIAAYNETTERNAALAKLTARERKLLGLK